MSDRPREPYQRFTGAGSWTSRGKRTAAWRATLPLAVSGVPPRVANLEQVVRGQGMRAGTSLLLSRSCITRAARVGRVLSGGMVQWRREAFTVRLDGAPERMRPRAMGAKANSPAKPPNRRAGSSGQRGNQSTTLITVLLALALLAVGAAGYQAASLLHYAMSTPVNATAASTAALVCDALKRQDYQQLVAYIDPAPIPPSVTGAFDPHATITQLQTRDAQAGQVVSCATAPYGSGSVVSTDGATRYQLIVRRAKDATPTSGALVLRKASGGANGWLIERDSSFLMPGGA